MTAEELTKLTVQQLATLVVQSQETIAQLQARIAKLESVSPDSLKPASSDAAPILVMRATSADAEGIRHRHHHKRSWYRRLWRAIFPANSSKRQYVLIILVMILIALVLGMFIAESMNRVVPPKNPTPVKRVVKLREHSADVFVDEVDPSATLRTSLGSALRQHSMVDCGERLNSIDHV
ncbi:hypothetical protein ANRL1_02696 [Anaerolineae bacterium]|nr:hypothetical protein ANRL1_02696 [Anaerolineae bacterium]